MRTQYSNGLKRFRMIDILQRIYDAKSQVAKREETATPLGIVQKRAAERVGGRRRFLNAVQRASGPAIIGEIKRASPSAGLISRNFDPAAIAAQYERAGVDCISVLTETDHFLGELSYLDVARGHSSVPILRKDFLQTRYDVAQSAAFGADAVLLIVAGLSDAQLRACMDEARLYDLDVLVEVHDAHELDRALALQANLIGINNRDLRTFETDLRVSEYLLPKVPAHVTVVSESGMRAPHDIARLYCAGARGFLVGEAFMRADDPGAALKAMKSAVQAPIAR